MGLAPYAAALGTSAAERGAPGGVRSGGGPAGPIRVEEAAASATSSCCGPRSGCASTPSPAAPSGSSRTSCCAWTRLMHERYGGARLALGGGVFMNVKANMLLAGEDWVEELFVFPSCGDESNAVGAAYLGYLQECARRGVPAAPAPFGPRLSRARRHRRGGRGRDPRARSRRAGTRWRSTSASRSASPSCWSRTAWWPAARGGWSSGRGPWATGRSWPTRPTTRVVGAHQPDDQEPRLLDAVRPHDPRGARGRLPGEPEGPGLALHDAGLAHASGARATPSPPPSIPTTARRGRRSSSEAWNPEYHAVIREFERRTGHRRRAEHVVQPPRRADRVLARRMPWTPSSARAFPTSPSAAS